jgi:predicted O-methyltransferase YrrM
MRPLVPRNVLEKLRSNLHEHGLRETVEVSALWATQRLLGQAFHRHSRVPLSVMAESAESMNLCAETMAQTYLFSGSGKVAISQLKKEYELLSDKLAERYAERKLQYPRYFAVESGSALLLYALVRSVRPRIVLETGVADGHSSFFILSAMRANDYGVLHSMDCSANVGSLLAEEECERWKLHVLDLRDLKKSFSQVLKDLPQLDLFFHDSDHTNAWQSFELAEALKRIVPGGILASDDCDSCYAFLDVCRNAGLRPAFLVEKCKVFGLAFTETRPPAELRTRINEPAFAIVT